MNEQALLLGRSQPVVGVLTDPTAPDPQRPIVILSNAGIVHRVGPARVYVRIARRLAESGYVVVRIDHRGVGDSDPRRDATPFQRGAPAEMQEVMDDLETRRGVGRFVIMGICSGADVAFAVAAVDVRVVGVSLINSGGMAGHRGLTQYMVRRGFARRYWRESIFRPERWVRALTGRIQYRAALRVLVSQAQGAFRSSNGVKQHARSYGDRFQELIDRGTHVLLVHSSGDPSLALRDMVLDDRIKTLTATGRFRDTTIVGADHTFTLLEKQEELLGIIAGWIASANWSEEAATT